jgi:prepilin-type N-terminal cleavage/methylation domain-containing protein
VSSHQRGFSLVEALVALLIVGVVLLGALGFFWQQRAATRRLRAHRAAELALESSWERLRAGEIPLIPGPVATGTPEAPTVALTLAPGERTGTVVVELTAIYDSDGRPYRRTLRALVATP